MDNGTLTAIQTNHLRFMLLGAIQLSGASPVTGAINMINDYDDPYEGVIDYTYLMLMQDESIQLLGAETNERIIDSVQASD